MIWIYPDSHSLNSIIIDKNINAVINCAAYTAVDKAEKNIDLAKRVNSFGVYNLVEVLEKVNGKINSYFNRLCI